MSPSSLLLVLALAVLASSVSAAPSGDLITNLPGFGVPTPTVGKQYSGFIAADSAQTVFLHYWFSEASDVDPSTAPVVVWMNGGPGCSSLGGFFFEQGPFTFTGQTDSTGLPLLMRNNNSWATIANVIFLEQPIGVGFSYAVNGSTSSDDYTQSQNTYGFMLNFFQAYPEYANNQFFITGESYAGIYVPTLANRIMMGNAAGNPKINLVGFAVGNGCMGNTIGTCGDDPRANKYLLDQLYGHGMVDQMDYAAADAACEPYSNITNQCNNLLNIAFNDAGSYDVYNVYDICGNDLLSRKVPFSKTTPHAPVPLLKSGIIGDPIVCIPSVFAQTFLDDSRVRKAIHVENSTVTVWNDCSGIDYNSNLATLIPTYPLLIAQYRVWIYSGDADACVPWTGSEDWTRNLYPGITPASPWHPWTYQQQYTGGFVVNYNANFTFLTIKHAGHLVPQYEPEAALAFYSAFLSGTPL